MREIMEILGYVNDKREHRKVLHKLKDIIFIVLCAKLANADNWIEPNFLNNLLQKWNEMLATNEGEKLRKILAIDGKTQRGNGNFRQKANHIVSAVDENGICFGQKLVQEKTNEIKAIPELLDDLKIANTIITTDAMGTQTKTAKQW